MRRSPRQRHLDLEQFLSLVRERGCRIQQEHKSYFARVANDSGCINLEDAESFVASLLGNSSTRSMRPSPRKPAVRPTDDNLVEPPERRGKPRITRLNSLGPVSPRSTSYRSHSLATGAHSPTSNSMETNPLRVEVTQLTRQNHELRKRIEDMKEEKLMQDNILDRYKRKYEHHAKKHEEYKKNCQSLLRDKQSLKKSVKKQRKEINEVRNKNIQLLVLRHLEGETTRETSPERYRRRRTHTRNKSLDHITMTTAFRKFGIDSGAEDDDDEIVSSKKQHAASVQARSRKFTPKNGDSSQTSSQSRSANRRGMKPHVDDQSSDGSLSTRDQDILETLPPIPNGGDARINLAFEREYFGNPSLLKKQHARSQTQQLLHLDVPNREQTDSEASSNTPTFDADFHNSSHPSVRESDEVKNGVESEGIFSNSHDPKDASSHNTFPIVSSDGKERNGAGPVHHQHDESFGDYENESDSDGFGDMVVHDDVRIAKDLGGGKLELSRNGTHSASERPVQHRKENHLLEDDPSDRLKSFQDDENDELDFFEDDVETMSVEFNARSFDFALENSATYLKKHGTDDICNEFTHNSGVCLRSIDESGETFAKGIRQGYKLMEINRQNVETTGLKQAMHLLESVQLPVRLIFFRIIQDN